MSRRIQLLSVFVLSLLVLLSCNFSNISIDLSGQTPTATALQASPQPTKTEPVKATLIPPVATAARSPAATQPPRPTSLPTTIPGGGQAGFKLTPYDDPEGFFTLQVPVDWARKKSGSQQQFCSTSEGRVCIAINLMIKAVHPDATLGEALDLYAERTQNYKETRRGPIKADGLQGAWAEISYSLGEPRQGAVALIVHNRIGFALNFWTPAGQYGPFGPLFEQVTNTIKISRFKDSPDYDEWESYDGDTLTLYYLPGTWAGDNIANIGAQHDQAFSAIQGELGISSSLRPEIVLYPSKSSLYHATYRDSGFAIEDASEVHALWIAKDDHQTPGHELTHVVAYEAFGSAGQALLGEGLAVCLDQSGRDYRVVGRDLSRQGKLVPLQNMLGDAWFKVDSGVAYQQSGSFVCYLLEEYGVEEVGILYTASDLPATLKKELPGSPSLAAVEKAWKDWLEK